MDHQRAGDDAATMEVMASPTADSAFGLAHHPSTSAHAAHARGYARSPPPPSQIYPASQMRSPASPSLSFASAGMMESPGLERKGSTGTMLTSFTDDPLGGTEVMRRPSDGGEAAEQRRKEATGWRRFFPSSVPTRLFLILVVVETLVNLAIEADLLYRFNVAVDANGLDTLDSASRRTLPVYLCIFGMAHLFQLIMAFDATLNRNTIQIIGLSIFNGLFLAYAVIQMSEINGFLGTNSQGETISGETPNSVLHVPVSVLTGGILGMIALSEVGYIVLSYFVFKEFGWETYKNLGADRMIKRYYTRYQIFICIVRFSAFFFAGFGIQLIFLVLQKTDAEYYVTIVALPLSILLLVFGTLAARQEWLYGMIGFMVGLLVGCGYFAWKLYRIWSQQSSTYAAVYKSLTVFACLSLFMLILTFVAGILVMRNFDHGLKRQLDRSKQKRQNSRRAARSASKRSARHADDESAVGGSDWKGDGEHSSHELEVKNSRMSID